jgi:hypothetical protein
LSPYNKSQALAPWYGIASAIYGFYIQPRQLNSQLAGAICTINVLTAYNSVMSLYIFDVTVGCKKLSTTHELFLFLHNIVIHAFAFITLVILIHSSSNGRGDEGDEVNDILNLLYHIFMGVVCSGRLCKVLIVRCCKRIGRCCERLFGLNMNDADDDEQDKTPSDENDKSPSQDTNNQKKIEVCV